MMGLMVYRCSWQYLRCNSYTPISSLSPPLRHITTRKSSSCLNDTVEYNPLSVCVLQYNCSAHCEEQIDTLPLFRSIPTAKMLILGMSNIIIMKKEGRTMQFLPMRPIL